MQNNNLLLILTDQQSYNAMSCAGNPFIHTPAMDQLASRGVRFTRAFCSYPHCVPSRSAMFYGRMPHEVLHPGTAANMSGHSEKPVGVRETCREQEIAKLVSKQGYDCVYAGKWHIGKWGPTESLRDDYDTAFRSLCDIRDPDLPDTCDAYFQSRDPGKPFFMVASFDNPHNICEWSSGTPLPWGNLPEPPARSELPPLPPNFEPSFDEPGQVRAIRHNMMIEHDWTLEDWRRFRWAYFRLVEKADCQIGRLLDRLEQNQLLDNTVILFTSDHGDMQGAHRLKNKNVFYEEAIGVPFILVDPQQEKYANTQNAALVSNAPDLYATIADYAGVEIPGDMGGRSLKPAAEGESLKNPRTFVAAEHENFHGPRRRMIRTEHYKYCVYESGTRTEQLFDLENDPGEMVNLVSCKHYHEELERHRGLCLQWMADTDDVWHAGHYCHPDTRRVPPGGDFPEAAGGS